jgi:hypothetical protein
MEWRLRLFRWLSIRCADGDVGVPDGGLCFGNMGVPDGVAFRITLEGKIAIRNFPGSRDA